MRPRPVLAPQLHPIGLQTRGSEYLRQLAERYAVRGGRGPPGGSVVGRTERHVGWVCVDGQEYFVSSCDESDGTLDDVLNELDSEAVVE